MKTSPSAQQSPEPPLDREALEASAAEAEAFLRSLASRHRLMILCRLVDGEASVGEMLQTLGLNQSNLSRHLALLREEGLVATRREGTVIHYRIASDRVRPFLAELQRLFCSPHAGSGDAT
jgi:DNA-binding transcriptional ArsR family regulator